MPDPQRVVIWYTNHRGTTEERTILPECLYWGTSEHHPAPQWLLSAWCFARQAPRTFAMLGIKSWRGAPAEDNGGTS